MAQTYVNTQTGKELILGKPNEFVSHNPQKGDTSYTPGECLTIKNGKLYTSTDNIVNPYKGTVKIEELQNPFVFVCINKNSWYSFRLQKDDEGNDVFKTGRNHNIGLNDNRDRAFEQFQKFIQDDKSLNEVKQAKQEALKNLTANADKKVQRINQIKNLRNEILSEIKIIMKDQDIATAITNTELIQLTHDYIFFDTLLKAV
jgi:hypothetical protein